MDPEQVERLLMIGSSSKLYNMHGWKNVATALIKTELCKNVSNCITVK